MLKFVIVNGFIAGWPPEQVAKWIKVDPSAISGFEQWAIRVMAKYLNGEIGEKRFNGLTVPCTCRGPRA